MEIPRHWRLRAQRYRLEGSICPTCGQGTFPPRPVCPRCIAQPAQVAGFEFSGLPASKRIVETVSLKERPGWPK
ncbi:MAG TPA: zinc ribbon domain-containing protein [Anaerolineales bacterium]